MLRVMVVDDDADTVTSMASLLRLWGHETLPAHDAAAALEMALVHYPDVLLLDLAMPGLSGLQLAKELRGHTCFSGSVLIAITGYADEAHRLLCAEAGFDHCLAKPIDLSALRTRLSLEHDRLASASRRG